MVCFAIVACLDPAQSWLTEAAISWNSGFLFSFGKDCPEFRKIAAAVSQLCAGSRHATIAKQAICKNFRMLIIQQKMN